MEQPLISIIIPIYNVEKYLQRCLDSVKNQTYTNLEILLIDDGSSDDSGKIADEYAGSDFRFKVFHIPNGGVSNARNLGLKSYQGEYIAFIDADDFVDKKYIERIYYSIVKCNVLLARCMPYDSHDEMIQEYSCSKFAEPIVIEAKESFDYTQKYAYGPIWGTLFHKSIIEGTFFDNDIYVGEDALFFARILKKCSLLSFLDEQLYVYVIYPESASHGIYNEKKGTCIQAWNRILEVFNEYSEFFLKNLKAKYCYACLTNLKQMKKSNYLDKAWHKYVLREARRNIKELLQSSYGMGIKVSAFLYCLFPEIYGTLHSILRK